MQSNGKTIRGLVLPIVMGPFVGFKLNSRDYQMDNFEVKLTGYLKSQFEIAMKLSFEGGFGDCKSKATHATIDPLNMVLTLYWSDPGALARALPYPMTCNHATNFVWGWLEAANYGNPTDIDGSVKKGFTVSKVCKGYDYSIVSVLPIWAEFHK